MGKQTRIIAQKAKVKQQQNVKKPKAVKTNLKRVRDWRGEETELLERLDLVERTSER